MWILAGDVGGTNTRLALYARDAAVPAFLRTYPSAAHDSLESAAELFAREARDAVGADWDQVRNACVGVAGPVEGHQCKATNLPWHVDARRLAERLDLERVELVNDFVAAASAIPHLAPGDLVAIGSGTPEPHGPIAVLGPGTGLGEAFLIWQDRTSHYRVLASEGGHADFAPRTPLEFGLMEFLSTKHGRVSNERVLSGDGLADAFRFLSDEHALRALVRPETRRALATELPEKVIAELGSRGEDPVCEVALSLFASVLGSVAGNLALTLLATGGVFVAGGIAPRIVGFLQRSGLREAFDQKGRFAPLLRRIPLHVIVHENPGLLGAARIAVG